MFLPVSGRSERRAVTYRELEQQADALASFLSNLVAGECVVAILLPRSSEHLYSSQLAVLKAGAAYACIDTASPDDQLRDILRDSDAVALLTDIEGLARAARCGFAAELVFDVSQVMRQRKIGDPPVPSWLSPKSLAYVIYTSGTTGRPKGVMIEHAGISNLVRADIEEFALTHEDRVAQSSSPAYDSSLEEIWLAFAAGGTVVVMDDDTVRSGPDLVPWLQRERVTVLCPPPTLLRTTGCDEPDAALPELSFLYVGGEALPSDVAERWARGRRLVNGYGPTECTVTALRGRIEEGEPITIGRPVPGLQAWVLDESLNEVSCGQQGELCIGGVGLARGYRNRPELNDEKFPVHPRLGRIYRTGDLAHRDPDGRFFYAGRMDSQVKLRGYRIELEAIEARLAECEGVREAACRLQQNGSQPMLVAFIVSDNGQDPRLFDNLKAYLLKSLPAYMVPSRFAFLPKLPTTVGGKLNRKQLPYLESQYRDPQKQTVAPRTLMEEKIVTAFREVLRLPAVDIYEDFFYDLGGDSLNAAELISRLRDEPSTASITVRDLYEARCVVELALRAHAKEDFEVENDRDLSRPAVHPVLASCYSNDLDFDRHCSGILGRILCRLRGYANADAQPWADPISFVDPDSFVCGIDGLYTGGPAGRGAGQRHFDRPVSSVESAGMGELLRAELDGATDGKDRAVAAAFAGNSISEHRAACSWRANRAARSHSPWRESSARGMGLARDWR